MEITLEGKGPALGRALTRRLRRLPQLTRQARHLRTLVQHSTWRRLGNLLLVEAEYRLRRTVLGGRPYILFVDPTNVCNLRCPLCPTGTESRGRRAMMMPWETFTRVIDQLAPYAYEVNLHSWGESLLHKHVFEMIAYCRDRGLATNMSENFNLVQQRNIDRLIESGLEYLVLSIDGVSQDVYKKYRVGGNVETVLANARYLVERRRALGSATPVIEWQFILMRHNAHEVELARRMAADMGIDVFRVIPPGIPFDSPNPEELRREWFVSSVTAGRPYEDFRSQPQSACFYLYRSFTVNPDGRTAPCCIVTGTENDFGDMLREDFAEIWNNAKYRSARAQFRSSGRATVETVCDRCDLFAKRAAPAGVASSKT